MSEDENDEAEIALANQLAKQMVAPLGGHKMVVVSTALTEVVGIWLRMSSDDRRDWLWMLSNLSSAAFHMANEIPDGVMEESIQQAKRKVQ